MKKYVIILTLLLSIVDVSGITNDDYLVLYLSFDETEGEIARDASGNGHDGKFKGNPKRVQGKFGNALEFNGQDNYVVVQDHDDLDLISDLTICAWFCPKADLTNRRMMSKNNSVFIIFEFGHKQSLDFLVKPNNTHVESKTTEWEIGKWYHFAGTFNGKTMKIYINGELEGETKNNRPISPSIFDLWIGADDYGRPSDHFPGKIDEVRIYNKALTETAIQTIMYTDKFGFYHSPSGNAKGDVNGDGAINSQDLILVANAFGTSNKAADVNRDGEVNVVDLVIVAQALSD